MKFLRRFKFNAPAEEYDCPPLSKQDQRQVDKLRSEHGGFYCVEGNWHYSCTDCRVDWIVFKGKMAQLPRAREYHLRQKIVIRD